MMKHLTPKTRDITLLSNKEKIQYLLTPKWISYPRAQIILNKMEDLMTYPSVDRMPNLLIVGNTNNGKTALIRHFERKNPAYISKNTEKLILPVLSIQAPPEPDERSFYNKILEKLNAPIVNSEKPDSKQRRIIFLFKELEIKLLIIDEIHHVLSGTAQKQRLFLNVLKYLSNELRISIVCAGILDAYNVIQSDSQLANRFDNKRLDYWINNEEYYQFLVDFEAFLPLKEPSMLIENSIATKILQRSEGLIGEIATILIRSCKLAIESKKEKITHNIIDNIDYTTPSDRKKASRRFVP